MVPSSMFPANKRIAFTGRLASLSRALAVELLIKRGGVFRSRVTQQTDILVIGADGWPLRSSGTLTRNLSRANQLSESGHAIEIISEQGFLCRCDALTSDPPVRSGRTIEQLSHLLGVTGLRIRRWVEMDLLKASSEGTFSPTFDFQAVAAAKFIWKMNRAGVPLSKLAQNLRALQKWLPDDRLLLSSIVALEKRLLFRSGLGPLLDQHGQLHFAFNDDVEVNLSFRSDDKTDPDKLFESAFSAEKCGHFDEAMRQYQLWITQYGEDPDVQFNLANVLAEVGQLEAASQLYRQVLKTSPGRTCAWNNLGLCEYRAGDYLSAIHSLQRAADLDPLNINYLFNLGDALDETGNASEANAIWKRIAKSHIQDEIVDYAHRRALPE